MGRAGQRADSILLKLDAQHRTATLGDRVVRLSALEFAVLRVLVENAPRFVSYDDLLTAVWGPHATHKKNYLKLYVYYLRSKMEPDPARPQLIVNERQKGYRLVWPDHEASVPH